MINWHRVGQMVACIDPWEWFVSDPDRLPGLHERDIYTIGEVRHVPDAEVSPVLFKLREIDRFYPAQRFQPVRDTSIDCFKVKEDA